MVVHIAVQYLKQIPKIDGSFIDKAVDLLKDKLSEGGKEAHKEGKKVRLSFATPVLSLVDGDILARKGRNAHFVSWLEHERARDCSRLQ